MDRQSGAFSLPKLGIGVALVLLGLVMPLLVNVDNLGVYSTLFMALERQDTVLVLYAAIRLVALNTLRCIPHYLGAFFIGESINTGKGIQFRQGVKVVLILAIIPLVYRAIEGLYGIHYDFGAPAILLIFMIVMLEKADFTTINVAKKALMLCLAYPGSPLAGERRPTTLKWRPACWTRRKRCNLRGCCSSGYCCWAPCSPSS